MKIDFKQIKTKEIVDGLISFIKEKAENKDICLGLSGGIDSTISLHIAVQALGKERVKAIIIDNNQFTKEGIATAENFANKLGVSVQKILSSHDSLKILKECGVGNPNFIQKATVDVRVCDLLIKTIAQNENRLFMGTINGTERLIGWFPKGALYGDFCPIGGVLKNELKQIAEYLGLEKLNESISEDASIVCGGCGELETFKGLSYEDLDKCLYFYSYGDISDLEKFLNINSITLDKWKLVLERLNKLQHKRDVFPEFYFKSS